MVDVDGTRIDDFDIDKDGNIIKHTITRERDAFFLVNTDGNRSGKELILPYGAVKQYNSQYLCKNIPQIDWFTVIGDANGKLLFEFLAKHTYVEWSHLLLGKEGNMGLNIISTSHNSFNEACCPYLLNTKYIYGYTIRKHVHNHPSNNPIPSGIGNDKGDTDISFVKDIIKKSGTVPLFYLFVPATRLYIQYGQDSKIEDFAEYNLITTLKTVIIKPKD